MPSPDPALSALHAIVELVAGAPPAQLRVERRPLRGGLESASVDRVAAHYRAHDGRERVLTLVAKRLTGASAREAALYEHLVVPQLGDLSPGLHAVEHTRSGETVLYLEALTAVSTWPWRDRHAAQSVLDRAAELHARGPSLGAGETGLSCE
jgi:hypothetical protein